MAESAAAAMRKLGASGGMREGEVFETGNPVVGDRSPGGVLRFKLDRGVPLEPQNPYPYLMVILTKKGTHF